jgi:hypothetical protein
MILMVIHFCMVRFVLKENVYDDLYMFVSMVVMIVIGLSFLYLYSDGIWWIVVRYCVAIAIFAVFAIIYRNDIITLVSYVKKRFLGKDK